MKVHLAFLLAILYGLVLAACSSQAADPEPAQTPSTESQLPAGKAAEVVATPFSATNPPILLEDAGLAPEITNDTWINAVEPLTLASQHGKVVLMEFWTFGCINCHRVTPYIKQWHSTYAEENFQVITIHYPEFAYEREFDNVLKATQVNGITYPVALDNDGRTWRAYHQRFWPTTYLIDKDGHIRYKHIGEFNERSAAEAELAIATLLAEMVEN